MQKHEFEYNKVLAKCFLVEEAWHMDLEKLDIWNRHKFAHFTQIQLMKSEHQCPFLNPSPLPFDFLSTDVFTPFFSNLATISIPKFFE
jgi:hypothetical protein